MQRNRLQKEHTHSHIGLLMYITCYSLSESGCVLREVVSTKFCAILICIAPALLASLFDSYSFLISIFCSLLASRLLFCYSFSFFGHFFVDYILIM